MGATGIVINVATCKYCDKSIQLDKTQSTGHLSRHLNSAHRSLIEKQSEDVKKSNPSLLSFNFTSTSRTAISNDFPSNYVRWIASKYLPLNACEDLDFRRMCLGLNPNHQPIGREKVNAKILDEYTTNKAFFKSVLNGAFYASTLDSLTSSANETYLGRYYYYSIIVVYN